MAEPLLLLTDRAVLLCRHRGVVGIVATQALVRCAERALLVDPDPEQRPIAGCPHIGTGIKPCTSTLRVQAGYSDWIRIEGRALCLKSVYGLTDGTPPGEVRYDVRDPGQDFITCRER